MPLIPIQSSLFKSLAQAITREHTAHGSAPRAGQQDAQLQASDLESLGQVTSAL